MLLFGGEKVLKIFKEQIWVEGQVTELRLLEEGLWWLPKPIFSGRCLWVPCICDSDTKQSAVHITPWSHKPVSWAPLPTQQEEQGGDELSVPLFTCETESSGWMVDEISNVYVVVTLPGHHTPLFFKVMKKKSRTEDNWLLNVVSGTKCLLLPSFFLSFLLKLGQGKGASGRGGCNPGLMGPLWDWSFERTSNGVKWLNFPVPRSFVVWGGGEEEGEKSQHTELTGTLGT